VDDGVKKELLVFSVIGSIMLSGTALAFTQQSSSATLGSGSSFAEGSYINGTDSENKGRLTGQLSLAGGSVKVHAYKQISLWPDSSIESIKVDSTNLTSKNQVKLSPYENLYYVKIVKESGNPTATGTLYNYGG